jgi:hypothetical protein
VGHGVDASRIVGSTGRGPLFNVAVKDDLKTARDGQAHERRRMNPDEFSEAPPNESVLEPGMPPVEEVLQHYRSRARPAAGVAADSYWSGLDCGVGALS